MPSFVHYGHRFDSALDQATANSMVNKISICISFILLIVYAMYLFFSLKTHKFIYRTSELGSSEKPVWTKSLAIIILFISALLVAYESDVFVGAIEGMLSAGHAIFSELFMGVIFVAAVGNAVAAGVAIKMARKDKLDLAFQVSMGASIQVAILVAPLLVLYSFLIAKPFTFVFNALELISMWACVIISGYSLLDGESNWFEGAMFVAIYIILGLAFYFHP